MYMLSVDIYPHTDTLVCDEKKETLALLAPPAITQAASTPSSQLSQLQKLYKYTHAHFCIFTLTHTHHFSCSHLFPLTTALSSWCSCAHSRLQLACKVYVCMRVSCLLLWRVPAACRREEPTSGPEALEWTKSCRLEAVKNCSHLKLSLFCICEWGEVLKWHRGNFASPCSECLLFLCFTPLRFCSKCPT